MKKPIMKSGMFGLKGNKWKAYDVTVDGKKYHHQSKEDALRQFNAAKSIYKKRQWNINGMINVVYIWYLFLY